MATFAFGTWLRALLREAGVTLNGASRKTLRTLSIPKTRRGSERVPLPPSMREALTVHEALAPHGRRLKSAPKKSSTITKELRTLLGTEDVRWEDSPDAPALVALPAQGDQRLFLWVGNASTKGEYPIVALSDEPSLFLRYPSFAHYLADAFGARKTKALDAAFGSMAEAKRRTKSALARERLASAAEVEGAPLSAPPSSVRARATSARASARPVKATLDELDRFELQAVYTAKYRAQASAAFAALVAASAQEELFNRLRSAPFPSASVCAAALVRLAADTRRPLLVADVLAALDARPDVFNQEWTLDADTLANAIGKQAGPCFGRAFELSAEAPRGPRFTLRYAQEFLTKDAIAREVGRAVLAAADPVWALFLHEVKLAPAARKRVLESFLPRGYEGAAPDQFRPDDPQQHLHELTYALELDRCSRETIDRLERRANELASAFGHRVGGGDVFEEVVATAAWRRAERKFPGATRPIRDVVEAARPLTLAARALRLASRTKVKDADLDRFRGRTLTKQHLLELCLAAFEAEKVRNAALTRALAEVVLAQDPEHTYAKRALSMAEVLERHAPALSTARAR